MCFWNKIEAMGNTSFRNIKKECDPWLFNLKTVKQKKIS